MADPSRPPGLLTWGTTAAVIAAGALALYLVRGALLPRLEMLPDLAGRAAPEPPPPVETPVAAPEPEPEEPPPPRLTYEQIETMLAPLPGRVLELIAEGREDLKAKEYRDMDSEDEVVASRSRRFFQTWGRTWLNRLGQLEKATPPWEDCRIHAALEPTCALLVRVYDLLRELPSVTATEDGTAILDSGEQVVEEFLNPPPPEEEGEVVE
jgi:hypothetical protein